MRKKIKMNCKEFAVAIPRFLEDELPDRQMPGFLEHFETCDECNEELQIQFLVKEGIARLEDAADFNLSGELAEKVEEHKKILKRKRIGDLIIYCMEGIAVIAVIFILTLVLVNF